MHHLPMVTWEEAFNSAALIAWLSLIAGFFGWVGTKRAQRRVRVRATAGIGWMHGGDQGEPNGHYVDFVLYNNLPLAVGIHAITVELNRPERKYFGPWLHEPPPPTLEAQHSARIRYTADQLRALWGEVPKDAEEASKRRYRIEVTLGNGSQASSKWFQLPVDVELKPFEGDRPSS